MVGGDWLTMKRLRMFSGILSRKGIRMSASSETASESLALFKKGSAKLRRFAGDWMVWMVSKALPVLSCTMYAHVDVQLERCCSPHDGGCLAMAKWFGGEI